MGEVKLLDSVKLLDWLEKFGRQHRGRLLLVWQPYVTHSPDSLVQTEYIICARAQHMTGKGERDRHGCM